MNLKKLYFTFILLPLLSLAAEPLKVTAISDTAILSAGEKKFELAGIYIPPKMLKSVALYLQNNFINAEIEPEFGVQKTNRHGNLLAEISTKSGVWLQGEILKRGLAYAYPTSDNNEMAAELFAAEKIGRDKKAGLWAENEIISGLSPDEILKKYKNKFVVFEGEVRAVKRTKEMIYINFGDDWKTDVTAGIRKDNFKNFKKLDIEGLVGKKISARGWVGSYNGPFIEIYDAGQVGL